MLRDYQLSLANDATKILARQKIVYLAMEMRIGKSRIALQICDNVDYKKVLFITKKKAISSILADYAEEKYAFNIEVINFEQAVKYTNNRYDCIILDEAHSIGSYPKPAKRTQIIRDIVGSSPLILLSGTPTPESYSQIFHQFWISENTPFEETKFYTWAKKYVNITQRKINGLFINDYSKADLSLIEPIIAPYIVKFTQREAGFEQTEIEEHIKWIDMDPRIKVLIEMLCKHKVYKFKNGEVLLCDTAVKLQQKVHQICSGTVKTEDGNSMILDISKATYIKNHYQGKKIAIFYKFVAEREALISQLANYTESPEKFNQDNDSVFISQLQSGSMGVNLSTADILIFYNIDFSAMQYWQARARIQTLNRDKPAIIHWLFTKDGIEQKVYNAVIKKQDYTVVYFNNDYFKRAA